MTRERASLVPTLLQCGYACGLLFIIPIGDIARRRPLIIGLILVTSLLVRHPRTAHPPIHPLGSLPPRY